MDADNPALLALVRAVSDGAAVDWDSATRGASESFRAAVAELRLVADIVSLNRSLQGESGGGETVPGPPEVPPSVDGPLAWWGHLHLLDHIASGSFGDVYSAWDPQIHRKVALKVLRPRPGEDHDPPEPIKEGRLLARVRHENVVTVYGAARVEGRDGIWMEFVEGRTLAQIVQQDGPLSLSELRPIAQELCKAVAAIHDAGLLHRDIKAQNVMRTDDGRVVLMDLGTGVIVGDDRHGLAGTPLYLAPEVLRGDKPTISADVYSLGVLLRYLVTGRFTAGPPLPQLEKPRPSAEMLLGGVIARATASDPQARFATARDLAAALEAAAMIPHAAGLRHFIAVAAVLVALATLSLRFLMPASAHEPPPRVVTLTNMKGAQGAPSFSPDGSRVAFHWWSETDHENGIYVKALGSSRTERLADGSYPSWSPDGRAIAFFSGGYLCLVSPNGGAIRKLSEFPVFDVSWSPDGRHLAGVVGPDRPEPAGLYLLRTDGAAARPIVHVPNGAFSPAFSPDGHHVAYVGAEAQGNAIHVVELDDELRAIGIPRRITGSYVGIGGITWTADGRELIFGGNGWPSGWRSPLRRVPADGSRVPVEIEAAGQTAREPAISRDGTRLAFAHMDDTIGVWRFVANGSPAPILVSSAWDQAPSFSSSGAQLVFSSTRAGDSTDIWIANADGSDPKPVTHGPGHLQSSPRWSADDLEIVFASGPTNGTAHVWTVGIDGGHPRQMTNFSGNQWAPSWSRDGRWIYYTQDDPKASPRIWRMPTSGGSPAPLTPPDEAAALGLETADGRELVYDAGDHSKLRLLPLSGGSARTLVECQNGFATAATGIYYVACEGGSRPELRWLNPETGAQRILGVVNRQSTIHDVLAVSPDESAILFSRWEPANSGIWMIENFR